MLASLNAIGVVKRVKQGRYKLAERLPLDEELSLFLLHADMLTFCSSYRTYAELRNLPEMFPFTLNIQKERLANDERFSVGYFGHEFTVALKER